MDLKLTYIDCKDWTFKEKLKYMTNCIGRELKHSDICGWGVNSMSELMNDYSNATYIYFDGKMFSFDTCDEPCPMGGMELIAKERALGINDTEVAEWNGEGLPPVGAECEWIGGGLNHGDWGLVIVRAYNDDYAWIEKLHDNSMHTVRNPAHFRKPESPEEKEQRERLEAAYDLYCDAQHAVDVIAYDSFEQFKADAVQVKFWLAIVDKTNYRKGE